VNTVLASFNTIMGLLTEMSKEKKKQVHDLMCTVVITVGLIV